MDASIQYGAKCQSAREPQNPSKSPMAQVAWAYLSCSDNFAKSIQKSWEQIRLALVRAKSLIVMLVAQRASSEDPTIFPSSQKETHILSHLQHIHTLHHPSVFLQSLNSPVSTEDMLFNYGAFPQTWEDPKHVSEDTGCPGDNVACLADWISGRT